MSSDGKSVIVGSKLNDKNGADSGQARIYQEVEGAWIQVADDINGVASEDQSGFSVGINNDGTRVIVGSPYHNGKSGLIRAFALSAPIDSPTPTPTPPPTPTPAPTLTKQP